VSDKPAIPRLSVDYPATTFHADRTDDRCFRCGCEFKGRPDRTVWREHDDNDRPEMVFVVLCLACADRIIDPHPRLYARLDRNEPAPGVMAICRGCDHQVAYRCKSPRARASGGEGLSFPPADTTGFIDGYGPRGQRIGSRFRSWKSESNACQGFEAKGPT
jgi:hypothetical protein